MPDFEESVRLAAEALDWIQPSPVFIGGAVIPFYLDDFGRSQIRPTFDVDCIVPAVATYAEFTRLEVELRARGWTPDMDGPICRYRSGDDLIVDFMPAYPEALGFSGRWYRAAVASAKPFRLRGGLDILIPAPSILFACKLEAFVDRGMGDPDGSKDLEDIVALLDGCVALEDSLAAAPNEVIRHVAQGLNQIEGNARSFAAAIAHLPRGGDEEDRESRFRARIGRLKTGR